MMEDHPLGEGSLYNQLKNRLEDFNVRGDLARVGHDVWPVPGQEQASQQIATALKASLLLHGTADVSSAAD